METSPLCYHENIGEQFTGLHKTVKRRDNPAIESSKSLSPLWLTTYCTYCTYVYTFITTCIIPSSVYAVVSVKTYYRLACFISTLLSLIKLQLPLFDSISEDN
jgi:hypothetical protein